MDSHVYYLILLSLACLAQVHGLVFQAVFRLKESFKQETKALTIAEEYLGKEEVRKLDDEDFKKFESFVQHTKEKNQAGIKEGDTFMEHPVNIYHVMRRMAEDWPKSIMDISESENKKVTALYEKLYNITTSPDWPTVHDRRSVTRQMLMIQLIYLLDIHEMATGTLNGTKHDPLTLEEIADIAHLATELKLYFEATQWFEGLFFELASGRKSETLNVRRGAKALAGAYFRFGNYRKAMEAIERGLKIEPNDDRLQSELKYYQGKVKSREEEGQETDKPVVYTVKESIYAREHQKKYYVMCRGDIKKTEEVKRKLKCYFRRTSVPYRPAKVEVVNRDPLITMFHDVIYEAEMEQVKRMGKPEMKYSEFLHADGSFKTDYNYRVSMTAWMTDDSKLLQTLSRRITEKTGLSTLSLNFGSHAEHMQIVNYGIGGMYGPHYDYFDQPYSGTYGPLIGAGDRYATWMFYISDIVVGGNTVFPLSDTIVPVVKGAAAFWPNIFLNGTVDPRTLHAGCPVVIGSKWVMNKWIHESGNYDRWPCSRKRKLRSPLCLMLGRKC